MLLTYVILSILCLIDGWSFGVNDVQFLDFVPKTDIPTSIRISGTAEIYFAGFISIDLDFTQVFPLSTNVTFSCPEGCSLCISVYHDLKNTVCSGQSGLRNGAVFLRSLKRALM